MEDSKFYVLIKENTEFLANVFAVLTFLGTTAIFFYNNILKQDNLLTQFQVVTVPQKSNSEYFENFEKDTVLLSDCFTLTKIHLLNQSKKTIKNIEVSLEDYYSDNTPVYKGFYIIDGDSIKYFENKREISIPDLKPREHKEINIYSRETGIYKNSVVTTSEESFYLNETVQLITENKLDHWITLLVAGNKFIQVLIYIFTFIGVYFFLKLIVPKVFIKMF